MPPPRTPPPQKPADDPPPASAAPVSDPAPNSGPDTPHGTQVGQKSPLARLLWLALGWTMVGLGLLGVALPGLPTTPFLLVAAFAFSHSAPRLRRWLETHATFGPPILAWEERGAITPRAKTLAVTMMALVFAVSLALGLAAWILILQVVCMGGAALFILTRPD